MTTETLRGDDHVVHVSWPNGTSAGFPLLWLRDNCPTGFHPDTRERQFDLTSIPLGLSVSEAAIGNGEPHTNRFDPDRLYDHRGDTVWLFNLEISRKCPCHPGRPTGDPGPTHLQGAQENARPSHN